jgi:hypothetical protein
VISHLFAFIEVGMQESLYSGAQPDETETAHVQADWKALQRKSVIS